MQPIRIALTVLRSIVRLKTSPSVRFDQVYPLLKNRLTSVLYHLVSDELNSFVKHLYRHRNIEIFRKDIEFFGKNFNFVTLDDLVEHYLNGKSLPPFPLFLSFDDGHREMAEIVAPLLFREGVPASFFLITNVIDNKSIISPHKKSFIIEAVKKIKPREEITIKAEISQVLGKDNDIDEFELEPLLFLLNPYKDREKIDKISNILNIQWEAVLQKYRPYLNTDQIKELLAQGFDIGSHGLDHIKFLFLSDTQRTHQVKESLDYLQKNFGIDRIGFSFPNSHKGVSLEWISRMATEDCRISLFFSTMKFEGNSRHLVNRVSMDDSVSSPGGFSIENAKSKLARAYSQSMHS